MLCSDNIGRDVVHSAQYYWKVLMLCCDYLGLTNFFVQVHEDICSTVRPVLGCHVLKNLLISSSSSHAITNVFIAV